ncbi:MAG TPA: hypothetical protein VMD05_04020 [Candidatus Nanoarchaeia archaeon]|nr:hypothetical protein [Candidatus Nanoarchaeia archaeon]
MTERKETLTALQIGLFVVSLVWFLWSFRETFLSAVNVNEFTYFPPSLFRTWTQITDYSGIVGLLSRTVTSLVAVAAVALLMAKRLSLSSSTKVFRWLLVGEAIYWLSLFLSGVMAFLPIPVGPGFPLGFPLEAGIPCLVESVAIPIVLLSLVYQLRPGKPLKSAINWALIAGAVYIFCLWLNNTCNWLYVAVYTAKGWAYVVNYPENLLSFVLTSVGLLALAVYTAHFAKKSIGTETIGKLDMRTIGVIVTFLGLYYVWNYLTWIFFGTSQLWSDWFSLLLGHNMNLWLLSLPIVGIALLIRDSASEEMHLRKKYANELLIVAQSLVVIFLAVFVGAYLGGLPGVVVLQMEPVFRVALQILGGLVLLLVLYCLFVAMRRSKTGK